jgi:phosphatidylglycerophosphate synthase
VVREAAPGNLARLVSSQPSERPHCNPDSAGFGARGRLTVETPGGSTIAAIVFAIAALTDGLDGYIARSRQ